MHYNMLYIKQIQNKLTILSFIPNMTKKIQGYRMLEASSSWEQVDLILMLSDSDQTSIAVEVQTILKVQTLLLT